jgi:hypothetical protein
MKFIKILTVVFIVSFAVYPVFPQETAGDSVSSVETENQNKAGAGDSAASGGDTGVRTDTVDTGVKRISEDAAKSGNPAKTVKKKTPAPVILDEEVPAVDESTSGEDYLLSINEGNFKYKRIPDIKLADRTPSMAEQNAQDISAASADENNQENPAGDGFFGLSKTTADIVAKGGILLLLFGIFILYRLRSRGGGRRGSSTSVMKSYRK